MVVVNHTDFPEITMAKGFLYMFDTPRYTKQKFSGSQNSSEIEGPFNELNLRKIKWLLFGLYNPPSQSGEKCFHQIKIVLDIYSKFY